MNVDDDSCAKYLNYNKFINLFTISDANKHIKTLSIQNVTSF